MYHWVRHGRPFAAALLSMSFLSPVVGAQQTTVVRGEVLDASSSHPVEGAVVVVGSADRVVVTDELGYFELAGVPVGITEVSVARLGYQTLSGASAVIRTNNTLQVFLRPEAIELEGLTATVRSPDEERQRRSGYGWNDIAPDEIEAMRGRVGQILDVIRAKGPPRLYISQQGGSSASGAMINYCIESTRRRPSVVELGEEIGGCRPALIAVDGVVAFDPLSALQLQRLNGRGITLTAQAAEAILSLSPDEVHRVRFLQPVQAQFRYGELGIVNK